MSNQKDTSFSTFFKEDPFEDDKGRTPQEETIVAPKKQDNAPVLTEEPLADDADVRSYHRALRQYFVTGKKTSESLKLSLTPVLTADFLKQDTVTGFPLFHNSATNELQPLSAFLRQVFSDTFKEGEAAILSENLRRLERYMKQALSAAREQADLPMLVVSAMDELRKLDVRGGQGENFKTDCRKLQMQLVKHEGTLLPFSGLIAFQLLNIRLASRSHQRKAFVQQLKKLHSAMTELMRLHTPSTGGKKTSTSGAADPLGGMVSFDKIDSMMPASTSSGLPESRFKRVQACAEVLENGLKAMERSKASLFVTKEMAERFGLESTMDQAEMKVASGSACAEAKERYLSGVDGFVAMVRAMRMAELEVENKYDEDLHTPYFDGFGLQHLSSEDLQYLPEIVVIEKCSDLTTHPEAFLSLLSENIPVRVMAITTSNELADELTKADRPEFRQELSALAFLYRNTYVFQAGVDTPEMLNNAYAEGSEVASPTLWNVLLPSTVTDGENEQFVSVSAAIESRCFPRIRYDLRKGVQFGSRFDIGSNTQPEKDHPSYPLEVNTPSGKQTQKYQMTAADFMAMDDQVISGLEAVPGKYRTENLVPLREYLMTDHTEMVGKTPFIWMVDEANKLQQVAIPFRMLVRCKERLDNWQFIQELGGLNSYHVNRAIERAKFEWEEEKEAQVTRLKADMDAEVETVRKEESGKAMDRLVNVLLDLDDMAPAPKARPAVTKAAVSKADEPAIADEQKPKAAKEEKAEEMSSEVWIETFRCTSCNDCTDQLPAVFKYNSDKQAEVHNPKAGTYAKIVTVAEKCPAKCIHPGLPQNPNEAGAAELIARAKAIH